ncbi:DUF2213 domain-containing protein [Devosia alba]|uniref:DUF2213 domain-containing protein n=1 Tax=Devosia alba TaxID=3152360 RepID=UPI003266FC56
MFFADAAASLEGYRLTADGFLVADVRFARTGIQTYAGFELDRRDLPTVSVYRPGAEVFSANAMRSFAGRPLTLGHPVEAVSAQTWRQHSIGRMGEEITRDGEFVRGTVIVQDAAGIEMIRNGTRELSAGYQCEIQWETGQTSDGQGYQAVQRTIRGNHVAIVGRARAGSACRIGVAA